MRKASFVVGVGAIVLGCGSQLAASSDAGVDAGVDAQPVCGLGFVGDPASPVEMHVVALGADGASSAVTDDGSVALIFPPQGGRVIFAGVRARNLDPCGVELSGALRDFASNEVRVDVRTVNLAATSDGYAASTDSNISTFANVPICPNQWSSVDAFGEPYDLEMTLTDRGGRTASQKIRVVPDCAEPARAAECRCICKAGYILGETCATDGGADDATSDAPEVGP